MEYTFWKYYCWSSCLAIILSHLHSQLTDRPSEVLGEGRGVLLVKMYWVFIQNFGYEIKQHFVIQGPKLQIFLGPELALNLKFDLFNVK